MLTFTSCRNSVRCKRWIQHHRFLSIVSCLVLKPYSLGVWTGSSMGMMHQEARGNSRWATRKIYNRQFGRIMWHLLPRRGEPDLKTGESLFISLPVLLEDSRVWELFPQVLVLSCWHSMFDNSLQGMAAPFVASRCMGCCSSNSPTMLWS